MAKADRATPFVSSLVLAASILGSAAPGLPSQGASPSPQASPSPGGPTFLLQGETVQPFDAQDLDGVVKHVSFPKGSSTVLLFFLSGCPVCHRMIPEWNRAYERRPKGLDVVGVLLDQEPPGFFMATPISFPVLRSPGRAFAAQYKIQKVPLTLRVGPGGKVEDVGVGQLDPIHLGEIFRP